MRLLEWICRLLRRAPRGQLLVINGDPDPKARLCAALCDAYARGAQAAGWGLRRLNIGEIPKGPALDRALQDVDLASRVMVAFPLLRHQPPQILWDFFLQHMAQRAHGGPDRMVIVTELPSFLYREMGQTAISLPGLRNPRREFIGNIAALSPRQRSSWLEKMQWRGSKAA